MNTTTNTRGVSEAMVALDRALEAVNAPLITDKANERAAWEAVSVLQSHGATLRAALSAEPAAQGDIAGHVVHDVTGEGDTALLRIYAELSPSAQIKAKEGDPVYLAPPAQPAERLGVAGALADMRDAVGGCRDQLQERIKQLEAQPDGLVPDGWVLVPREPTDAMRAAFRADSPSLMYFTHTTLQCADFDSRYRAMLAASPAPSESEGGKGVEG